MSSDYRLASVPYVAAAIAPRLDPRQVGDVQLLCGLSTAILLSHPHPGLGSAEGTA